MLSPTQDARNPGCAQICTLYVLMIVTPARRSHIINNKIM